jgi:hypothetical protein
MSKAHRIVLAICGIIIIAVSASLWYESMSKACIDNDTHNITRAIVLKATGNPVGALAVYDYAMRSTQSPFIRWLAAESIIALIQGDKARLAPDAVEIVTRTTQAERAENMAATATYLRDMAAQAQDQCDRLCILGEALEWEAKAVILGETANNALYGPTKR